MEGHCEGVDDLDAVNDAHAGAEVSLWVLLDIVEGVLDILCIQCLAVVPLHTLTQMPGNGQGVVGHVPGLRRVRDDLLGGVQLGEAVVDVLGGLVEVVIRDQRGVEALGVAVDADDQGGLRGVVGGGLGIAAAGLGGLLIAAIVRRRRVVVPAAGGQQQGAAHRQGQEQCRKPSFHNVSS